MRFLPKANPLHENIPALMIAPPEILNRLAKGGFSGYVSFSSAEFEAYCVFAHGMLICVAACGKGSEKTGTEAIVLLFETILALEGKINVYSMTPDQAMCTHALVLGTKLFDGGEVRHTDSGELRRRIRDQKLNGGVHFYTAERDALIFYKAGEPIGFYHDSALGIETSTEESRNVALLPGARIDVYATQPIEELMRCDLLQTVNLDEIWKTAQTRCASGMKEHSMHKAAATGQDNALLSELQEDLEEIAAAYLSKEGRAAVESGLRTVGGCRVLTDEGKTGSFLRQIEVHARNIDGHARIDEMIELMKSEIVRRLAV